MSEVTPDSVWETCCTAVTREEGAPEGQRNTVTLPALAAVVIYWTNFFSKRELVWVEGRQSRLA